MQEILQEMWITILNSRNKKIKAEAQICEF